MSGSDPREQEFEYFKRVLDWTTSVVTKVLHEQGRVEPQVFFMKMWEKTIARVGVVTMPNGDAEIDCYIEIMRRVVASKSVDVSVYIREATERDATRGVDAEIVMFHLLGKVFEATSTARSCNDRLGLETAELSLSQMHRRGCTSVKH